MFLPETPTPKAEASARRMTMVEALREALREEMRRDERVILIGEDIGVEGGFGGAFTVTLGLAEEFGHRRVMDTPISEAAIAGVSAGAAVGGLRPVADVQYGDFLFIAMDQLANQAAKQRWRFSRRGKARIRARRCVLFCGTDCAGLPEAHQPARNWPFKTGVDLVEVTRNAGRVC